MKKCYAFLVVTVLVVASASGCSSFKGFCDRGSIFPTRQPQATQTVYAMTGSSDICCPGTVMMPACDPCGGISSSSRPVFSGPADYPSY